MRDLSVQIQPPKAGNLRRWMLVGLTCLVLACAQPQLLAEQTVVVVLDDSGSMDDRMRTEQGRVRRIDAAKQALTSVLSSLPPDTEVGVLALNSRMSGSNWIVPLGSGNPDQWISNIRRLRADGGTPLGAFMKQAADALLEARSQNIYGNYRLLIVTDGEANDGRLVDRYLPDILSRGITVDVIGVDMKSDHSLATRVHNYRRADDDRSLQQAISDVFAEASADDQDAAEGFELLAALPDGFAEQALEALSSKGNQPIVGSPQERATTNIFVPSGGGTSASGTASQVALGGLVCCFATLAAIIVLASAILKSRR